MEIYSSGCYAKRPRADYGLSEPYIVPGEKAT